MLALWYVYCPLYSVKSLQIICLYFLEPKAAEKVHVLTCLSFDCLKYFRFLARDLAYLACLVQVSYLFFLTAVVTHPLQLLDDLYKVFS
jgi:hypothetical protein